MNTRFLFALLSVTLLSAIAPVDAQSNYEPYSFTKFAGVVDLGGSDDGAGKMTVARFANPSSVAMDNAGNIYVSDRTSHTIRKISSAGIVSTFAGLPGNAGSADGSGNAARFSDPDGLAVDGDGNVYVADSGNQTVRKITPAGLVSTLAGLAGAGGSADGTASAARFNDPSGVALDSGRNVYVADKGNGTIRKITPTGVVSTFAGLAGSFDNVDGTGSDARFRSPTDVAVDSTDTVYVADAGNHTIRTITPGRVVSTLAGGFGYSDGTGTSAGFQFPIGLTVDSSGNVYVADRGNYTIRKITPAAVVTTVAGSLGNAGSNDDVGTGARFNNPSDVAVDFSGNLLVADRDNHTIRKITPAAVVSTFAGLAGVAGRDDGAARGTRFNFPYGVAIDTGGNVYVADLPNHTIRKITPAGAVSTVAGQIGTPGTTDGSGSEARFHFPSGVAVDVAGNLYVTDYGNHTIRKITPAGAVSTFAGLAEAPGSDNGTGSSARFRNPLGVAVDSAGSVYVNDYGNHTVRKITSAGSVTTFAGLAENPGSSDGTGSGARFYFPTGIAVDSSGNAYVAEAYNHTIRQITSAGAVSTLAGLAEEPGSADGQGSAARFSNPIGVAVDSAGSLYIGDQQNHTIRKIQPAGAFSTVTTLAGVAGSFGTGDGGWSTARFNLPAGVAVDSGGNVFVADGNNHTIRRVTPDGGVSTFAGLAGHPGGIDTAARFNEPGSAAVDTFGNVYVADTNSSTIRKITPNGGVSTLAGLAGAAGSDDGTPGSNARFNFPRAAAVDTAGNVYVADTGNHTIRKITPAGAVDTFAGLAGSFGSDDGTGSGARFSSPTGIAVDVGGNVYVVDNGNHTIRKITPDGGVSTLAGLPGYFASTDGTGSAARFGLPNAVAVDSAGNLYVSDTGNHTIRKITPEGAVSTLAGAAMTSGSADGTGSAARFSAPIGVAVDGPGNVYVADNGNHTVRKITPAGVVTTLGGLAGTAGVVDGTGATARLKSPRGVAVDSAGLVYVADTGSHTVRLGIPPPAQLISAVSRKTHSSFVGDVALPLAGPRGVECRSGGASGEYTIVFRFANTLSSVGGASVTGGTGSVSSNYFDSLDARNYIVHLTGVTNAQTITVTLTNVTDSAGNSSASVSASMGVLLGDTTGNGSVNSSDISQTKSQSGQAVTGSNFRQDVTVNGSINSSDISLVKSKSGTALP